MKAKTTRRALLMSALSLLMCASMLVGTTFAWFTDSASSANNIIQSGNLDIELEYWDGDSYEKVTDQVKLFDDAALWEPGHVEVAYLKISNNGSLALKYLLNVNVFGETTGVTMSGAELKLSEHLVFGVVDKEIASDADLYSREEAMMAAGDVKGLKTYNGDAKFLEKNGDADYVALIIYMPTTVGNEANHNGINLPSIEMGVNVLATQFTYEEDSFDNQYDAGLTPLEGDEVLVEENGIQYIYTPEGEAYLYLVTEGYTEDTVVVPEGITNIGNYAFAYNNNVKKVVLSSTINSLGRGFDSSNVETVILNEGLEVIDSRAFRSTPNLKEVVISSTVKTIADNAFQKSGIKNIVIPATVETIGETAFGSSMIESVTFEGNTSIQGYAFRGCTKLRTVHMEGDDVTFIPSTLNGRNSMWFCNGESNNPNTSNITFYVENDTMAARVKTAMGAEANNTPVYV
jgi:predicted ribosomally synthesized peptide with SipW-like signal peptide